jgi:hypothetical protein
MTNQHPITPPPELVQQWLGEENGIFAEHIATRAARWGADQQLKLDAEQIAQAYQKGADQELEACCEWLDRNNQWAQVDIDELRDARRPKPPSLKEQALRVLVENGTNLDGRMELDSADIEIISRALEALPND